MLHWLKLQIVDMYFTCSLAPIPWAQPPQDRCPGDLTRPASLDAFQSPDPEPTNGPPIVVAMARVDVHMAFVDKEVTTSICSIS